MKFKAIELPKTKLSKSTPRKLPVAGIVAAGTGLVAMGIGVGYAISHRKQLLDRLRPINKRFYNRVTLQFAGHEHSPYAVIQHVGRKTGHTYRTPVVAEITASGILIPLPYGQDTDWCQNVLRNGTARLQYQGKTYDLDHFEVVNFAIVEKSLKSSTRGLWRLFNIESYLRARATLVEDGLEPVETEKPVSMSGSAGEK